MPISTRKKTKQKTQKRPATQNPESRLAKLIQFCKDNNVLRVKMDGIELELAPPSAPKHNYDDGKPTEAKDTYTDEEILMWSANGQGY